jgi:hypothetical protein
MKPWEKYLLRFIFFFISSCTDKKNSSRNLCVSRDGPFRQHLIGQYLHGNPARRRSPGTSLMVVTGLLVSVGQGIHVGVVDERVVPVTPRELLQDHRKGNYPSVHGPITK